ncbi:hypothetical protein GCM10010992_01890 [Cloacibacterium rupense]|uniref:Uncharacterized protein n=1 Tax=Cloacibacterium rupense TaxID=517423 RepID=A0ABQ2NEM0_9FLAO|nr:hypothetical protein [Cloacibacterium rupense]GGP01455.1 hypothetical protein GCM10010992_01890 [Cloacibacterium rupense]
MKKIILSLHLIFGFFCFSQSAQELNSTRINKDIYDRQVSNYVGVKALNDMQTSAKSSIANQLKDLDEKFEFNFAQKEKLDSKLKILNQKKIDLQSKLLGLSSEEEKLKINKKISKINIEIEKNIKRLEVNEQELKILQKKYIELTK